MVKGTIRILSLDPGLTCTGWAISDYNTSSGTSLVIKRGRIEGKKALTKNKELGVIFTKQMIQLVHLEEEVAALMRYKPDYVVCENAFHQPGRTNAYVALILCIHTIERVVKDYLHKPLNRVAPTCVKLQTTNYGQANKDTVQEAVLNNPSLDIKETKQNPLEKMSEHEADAIGVMLAFTKGDLPIILLSAEEQIK